MKDIILEKKLKNSRSKKEELIAFINKNPQLFNKLLQLAISDNITYAWRAAWLLNKYIEKNDQRILPYTEQIIDAIGIMQDGHQRELLKILQKIELIDEQEGRLFNICLELWGNINKQSSVRHTAFKFIMQIAQKYPELSKEINYFAEDRYLEPLSKGIRHSVLKMTNSFISKHKL